jgi:Family of unknown function (DUF6262)
MPPADNSRYLAEASRRRHDEARDRAARAIDAAAARGTAVTVSGIAAAAGVSRSWLYTQDDLRAAIAELMKRRPGRRRGQRRIAAPAPRSIPGQRKKLREDNTDLRRRLEAAHGEIRRLRALAPHPGD